MKGFLAFLSACLVAGGVFAAGNDFRYMRRDPTNLSNIVIDVPTPASDAFVLIDITGSAATVKHATFGTGLNYNGTALSLSGVPISAISGLQTILDSAFSGNYNDLTNKPTLFSGVYADLTGKPTLFSGAYADLTGKPTLFSGDYADLTNKPTLFSGAYADLTGKPTIPTLVSELTNDTGFITTAALSGYLTSSSAASTYVPLIRTVNGKALTANISITKADVGLGNADNTSDAAKPVSTAAQTALDGKAALVHTHAASDIVSGTLADARIPALAISKTTGLQAALDAKFNTPSGTTAQYVRGDGSLATLPTTPARVFSAPVTVSLNTAAQLSTTRDVLVSYPIEVANSSLLLGAASGSLYLEYADNSAFTTNVVTFGPFTSAISGVLSLINTGPTTVTGVIPAGKYRRVRSVTNSGTVTFTPRAGQEVQL